MDKEIKSVETQAWHEAFNKYNLYAETDITIQRRDAYVEGYVDGALKYIDDACDLFAHFLREHYYWSSSDLNGVTSQVKGMLKKDTTVPHNTEISHAYPNGTFARIVHCDEKSADLFLDKTGEIKLSENGKYLIDVGGNVRWFSKDDVEI